MKKHHHPGLKCHIFHILTSKDIVDVISRFLKGVCSKSELVYVIKRTLHVENVNLFSCVKAVFHPLAVLVRKTLPCNIAV